MKIMPEQEMSSVIMGISAEMMENLWLCPAGVRCQVKLDPDACPNREVACLLREAAELLQYLELAWSSYRENFMVWVMSENHPEARRIMIESREQAQMLSFTARCFTDLHPDAWLALGAYSP
jgi:hypothetical protein